MKFEFIELNQNGLFVRHSNFPNCIIEILELENENCYQGGLHGVFDFFVFVDHKKNSNKLYQFLVITFFDNQDENDITLQELIAYKSMLKRCWKWFKFKYLITNAPVLEQIKFCSFNDLKKTVNQNQFSSETIDGNEIVTHLLEPVFKMKMILHQDPVQNFYEYEILGQQPNLNASEMAKIMRQLGEWIYLK